MIGFSLGGYFATYVGAAVKELGPKAIVVCYGMYALAERKVESLRAPLLILQGENDYKDFVTNAKSVQEISIRTGKACEVVFYPGAGHQFDLFEPSSAAARDAWD